MSVCTVLSPGKADVLYLPGYRRPLLQKPLFTGEAPVFTYNTLTASLGFFFRLNLKWRFHTRTVQGSCKAALPSDRHRAHAVPPGPTESTETLSVMQGWRFVILKRGSNGLSGY